MVECTLPSNDGQCWRLMSIAGPVIASGVDVTKIEKNPKITVTLTEELDQGLTELTGITRVPKAVYVREAIEDLLKKYEETLREARKKQKTK
jgi:hypothetical protein